MYKVAKEIVQVYRCNIHISVQITVLPIKTLLNRATPEHLLSFQYSH